MRADGFEQAVDHELLVEDGQLDGDARQFGEVCRRVRAVVVLAVLVVEIDQRVAVDAVDASMIMTMK